MLLFPVPDLIINAAFELGFRTEAGIQSKHFTWMSDLQLVVLLGLKACITTDWLPILYLTCLSKMCRHFFLSICGFRKLYCMFVCVYVCVCTTVYMWKLEDNLHELILS